MDSISKKAPAKPDETNPARHYGQIGISAVAAAVRYQAKPDEAKERSTMTLGDLDRRGLAA